MTKRARVVIGGVDTHGRTHHAAVIDQHGRLLGDAEFGATPMATAVWLAGCAATAGCRQSGSKAPAPTAPG